MFKKPLTNLKTFSPLRSSDRKRFQNEAYETYPVLKDICTQEGGSHLMPDDLRSAKFIAHSGTAGIVYTSEKQVLWIKLEDLPPIPSVYTLWQYPNMLPKLYTWAPVLVKLIDGADLMIPGLVYGPEKTLPNLQVGELVAITIKGHDIPIAIGTMAIASDNIKVRAGMKGKAVHIIHVYKDFLWALGTKAEPAEIEEITNNVSEEDQEQESETEDGVNEPIQEETSAKDTTVESDSKKSNEEIDEWLKKSLYHALVFKLSKEKASSVLPISASSFYSAYVMSSRPADIGPEIDIKKSSWKKLQKFIKTEEKSGLLKTKEQRGETMIMSINWSHPSLQDLRKYKTMDSTNVQPVVVKETKRVINTSTAKQPEQTEIQEIFKPLGNHMLKFFEEAKHDKDAYYTIPQVRTVLSDYIQLHQLADPQNPKMINIDAVMCDAVLTKAEYNTISKLGRDQILHRLCSKMQPFHTVKLPGKEPVFRKGSPKAIEITQEVRQGRKTVTKVTGVEGFGLEVEEIAKELTRLCASSATFNPIHGVSPKNPLYEIMVQGPQIKNVTGLLLSKSVPKRYIDVIDKTGKQKKK
ncbi:hypothetical protein BDB01DRAFT_718788 [Pilobolus umbonatus]|nr:hypothetical protein BDB01DRAFT_718788 [Pilobolus umbonatus]